MPEKPQSALLMPFEPTARLSLNRYGAVADAGQPRCLDFEIGGYLMVYVGMPGSGNIGIADQDPRGLRTVHPTQAIGGAHKFRDSSEAMTIAVHAPAALRDAGVLHGALAHLREAEARGITLGIQHPRAHWRN